MATQRTQIYIEGVALDLDKNVDIDFTYSITDIADFEKRTTTFSKTIYIPGTAHNNFLFGSYFDFNVENPYSSLDNNIAVNFNPLKKAFAKVTLDNIEIFAGVLRLLEIKSLNNEIIYECALFGSLNDLFTTLGDKLLTDLDLSDFDQLYSIVNIQDSWTNTDFIYALANYGKFNGGNDDELDVTNFRPTLFVKEIFNRIMSEANYTYNTTLWDTNNLDKIALLNNEETLSVYVSELFGAYLQSQTVQNFYQPLLLDPANVFEYYLDFDTVNNLIVNNTNNDIKATVKGIINWTRTSTTSDVISVGVGLDTYAQYAISGTSGTTNFEFTFTLKPLIGYTINAKTDTFSINVSSSGSQIFLENFDSSIKLPAFYDKRIDGRSFVPTGIKQSDFMKSIINLLNLYIVQDKDNEFNLSFIPYPDFYTENVIDWDYKKDLSKGYTIKSSNDFLPKTMSFKYKNDNDYYSKLYFNKYNSGYGNKTYITGTEFSKDDKSFELIFSLVPNAFINTDMALPAMFDINPDGTYKAIKTNPKLAFYGGLKNCNNYSIYNGSTLIDATNTTYPYFGHLYDFEIDSTTTELYDLAFEAPKEIYLPINFYPIYNLFVKYYQDFILTQDNKDAKLITLYFLLNTIDIMNLDFRNLIKVQNGLYYLNKIDGYNPLGDSLTKVELLRMATVVEPVIDGGGGDDGLIE
jgi:hypothetical protein